MDNSSGQRSKLRRGLLLVYVLGIHLILVALVFKTEFFHEVKTKFFAGSTTSNRHGQRMIGFHQAMDASVPEGAVIFLGDSITQGLATAAVAPYSVNYGIGAETSFELLNHLPKYQSLERASAIFLMIGINDIWQGKVIGLPDRLRAISAAIPSDKPLIWSGVMPAYSDKVDPSQIASANQAIKGICAKRKKCIYIDTPAIFSPEGSALFHDGVHPNDVGYSKWITALRAAYKE